MDRGGAESGGGRELRCGGDFLAPRWFFVGALGLWSFWIGYMYAAGHVPTCTPDMCMCTTVA